MTTAIAFPDIKPTSRTLRLPAWPATSKSSQAGVKSVRLWGSRPSDGGVDLVFANIADDRAALILQAYSLAKGHVLPLLLPNSVLEGMEQTLKDAWLEQTSQAGLTWHFAENSPPTTESVKRSLSTVRVSLNAELRLP